MKKLVIDLSKCCECGDEAKEMHHVIPKSSGGTFMVPLCTSCHCTAHQIRDRGDHKENCARGRDIKLREELNAVWVYYFKVGNSKKQVASILGMKMPILERRITRLEAMSLDWLEELFSPLMGHDTSLEYDLLKQFP